MGNPTWVTGLLCVTAAALGGEQRSVVFRPESVVPVHTRYDVTGSLRLKGFPDLADSTVGAYAAMVSRTRRVVESLGEAWIAEVTFDSSRMFYRPTDDQPWLAVPTPRHALGPARFLLDSHLLMSPMAEGGAWDMRLVRGLTGMPEFGLPDTVLVAGQRWTGSVALPYTFELPGRPPTTITIRLDGRATTRLDSVVPRAADTLAYLQISAGLNVVRVDTAFAIDDQSFPVTVWGSLGSSLVWSTGWDDWVTGVTTLRMHHRVDVGPAAVGAISMYADLVSRFTIRP